MYIYIYIYIHTHIVYVYTYIYDVFCIYELKKSYWNATQSPSLLLKATGMEPNVGTRRNLFQVLHQLAQLGPAKQGGLLMTVRIPGLLKLYRFGPKNQNI